MTSILQNSLDSALTIDLESIKDSGLHRRLRRVDTAPEPRVTIDGREVIVLGSNNYLGLATHPSVKQAAIDAAGTWGAGSSGSRLTTGNLALIEDLEADIATFKGTEAALVFGTGYMAGLGAIMALVGEGDLILSDALNHASLIDGCRLSRAEIRVYRHNDVDDARAQLADRQSYRRCLIVTDGVFSMDGDIAPLGELKELADEFDAWLMVDDAHGTGVLGTNGTGSLEYCLQKRTPTEMSKRTAALPLTGKVIQMGTLSKALGSEGGFIAGSRVLIDYLINRARPFIFTTAPNPAAIAAAHAALKLVRTEPERRTAVLANADRLRTELRQAGFKVLDGETPIVPVMLGDTAYAAAFAEGLLERGVYAPAIRPPTVPPKTARLRMSITATHTNDDIDTVISVMKEVRNDQEF